MKRFILPLLLLFSFGCEDGVLTSGSSNTYYGLASTRNGESVADPGGDRYNTFVENPFVNVSDAPVSTFSIDADGGSYPNVRRFISEGVIPPPAAVRTEELINYFPLQYGDDEGGKHPIALNGEVSGCPWAKDHKLIRIGIKGQSVPREQLPPSNLVLLIDVSGSMSSSDKLELLKSGFKLMVGRFTSNDRIAIVTYAGSAGVVLPSTGGSDRAKITHALAGLGSGGSTAGAQGIITAYSIAEKNFIEGGNNRVILGTDGDFNVGISSQEELVSLIESERDKGIFLTTIGVGRGNYNDAMLEQVADHGNGTYEYIDDLEQARKVFVDEYHKFYPAAKDVKVQIEFNPLVVTSYRLIGYENRLLQTEDFEDDKKDAGEISLGQNVTALYEIVPSVDGSAFRTNPAFTIQFRYKRPAEDTSIPLNLHVFDEGRSFAEASESMRFTASVAGFCMLLRDSDYKGSLTYDDVLTWTAGAMTFDPFGRRAAFAEIVKRTKQLPGS
jgi:Ca-activated chloride channel family protein